MAKPTKLSPSVLNLYLDCPRCFWNHFHGKKRPAGIFPSLPSGMDKVLKDYFDYYRKKKLVPTEIEEIGAEIFDEPVIKDWQNNFKGIVWQDPETGIILRGAVDEMLIKDGKLIVLDFKTRGYPLKDDTHEHYRDQLNIYNFLLRKNGRKVGDYGYLLFYHPKIACTGKDCMFEFHFDLKKLKANPDAAEKLFKNAVKCMQRDSPPDADGECGFCRFFEGKG